MMKGTCYCLAIASALLLSGCAGIEAPFVHNSYAGDYTGTYTSTNGDIGTASLNMTNIGNVFGTLNDTTTGKSGSMNGSLDKNLNFTGTVSFPGVASMSVTGVWTADHNIVTGTMKGSEYSDSFVVTKQ